jgi:hypothetical protein
MVFAARRMNSRFDVAAHHGMQPNAIVFRSRRVGGQGA